MRSAYISLLMHELTATDRPTDRPLSRHLLPRFHLHWQWSDIHKFLPHNVTLIRIQNVLMVIYVAHCIVVVVIVVHDDDDDNAILTCACKPEVKARPKNKNKEEIKIKISPVGDWRSTSLEWPWPWPWFRPYDIPSCISHRPLPTYQISLRSEEIFFWKSPLRFWSSSESRDTKTRTNIKNPIKFRYCALV